MSVFDTASLTEMLLVAKGEAAPSRDAPLRHLSIDAVRHAGRLDTRVRISLRVDEKRHRRLRLAAAHLHQSAQTVLLAALDHYIDHVVPAAIEGGCRCLEVGAAPQVTQFKPATVRSP
jgi:hypothetical protein